MEIIILWIILSLVCAFVGNERKVGAFNAFLCAILLSPIIGFIITFSSRRLTDIKHDQDILNQMRKMNGEEPIEIKKVEEKKWFERI